VDRLSPGLDAARQHLQVREAFRTVFLRPPGGCRLVRSRTVEDDLLVTRQSTFHGLEVLKADRAIEVVMYWFGVNVTELVEGYGN
jgi:hypothetical protein